MEALESGESHSQQLTEQEANNARLINKACANLRTTALTALKKGDFYGQVGVKLHFQNGRALYCEHSVTGTDK